MRSFPHFILLLALLFLSGCVSRQTLHPFTTDECSASSEGTTEDPHAWCSCCVEHDIAYWRGGKRSERSAADSNFKACITARGYPKRAILMHAAVRVWGSAYLPFPWRWGYGWPLMRGYPSLSEQDNRIADSLLTTDDCNAVLRSTCIDIK